MSVIEKTITFFHKTLGQDVITLSMHSKQAENITYKALDGFVVRAAADGLLVEVWIDDEKRNYEFGDYVELIKARGLDLPDADEEDFHKEARRQVDLINEDMNHATGHDDEG